MKYFKLFLKFLFVLVIIQYVTTDLLLAQNATEEYVHIEVYTGEEPGAGTNSSVNLFLDFGDYSRVIEVNKYVGGNAMERGDVDKFDYLLPAFNEIKNLEIKMIERGISSDWYLKQVIIRQDSGKAYLFSCNCWIGPYGGHISSINLKPKIINQGKSEIANMVLDIEVHTGDERGAGTNANVYLTLNTDVGSGAPMKLNNRISGNAFERNDIDKLSIQHSFFRSLKSINIRHDNKGAGAGWYLDKVSIKMGNGRTRVFECKCWLEGDSNGRTLR